jgi:arylsulfatase A-like enzyme
MTDRSLTFQERPIDFLLLAIWLGLISGFGEAAILAYKRVVLFFGPQVIWQAPLANACIFAIPGLVLFLLAWRWPRLVSLAKAGFIFTFLGSLSILMLGSIALYAELILSGGLAVEVARVIRAHSSGFLRIFRRTTPWLAAGVMSLAIGMQGFHRIHERLALAALPPSDPKAPNVLLIVMDTVRAQELSLYGYNRPTTPNLERLAKTGVVFDRAISTAPWTLPSHASMFTGRFPHELSTDWYQPLDNTYPTLAELLSSRGYLTAGFVANFFYCSSTVGLARGFLHYEDYPESIGEIFRSSSLARNMSRFSVAIQHEIFPHKSAADINDSFLDWTSHTKGKPFFAFLNYIEAHNSYSPLDTVDEWSLAKIVISEAKASAAREAYDRAIAYIDYEIGRLISELDKRGLLKNTLVIVTADHGEQFGSHGLFGHGYSLYRQLLKVPLLLSFPREIPLNKRVEEVASLRDLPATIVDLLHLERDLPFPGNSLARYWRSQPPVSNQEALVLSETEKTYLPQALPSNKGNMASLISKEMHYVMNGDGSEELYDFQHDLLEQHNLAHSSKDKLAAFRAFLNKTVGKGWLVYGEQ